MSRISAQPGVSDPWMDAYDAVVAPQVPQTGDDPWMAAYDAVVGTQTNSAESGQTAPGIVPAGMPGMAATIPVGGMSRVPAPAHGVVGDIGAGLATGVGQAVSQVGGAMEAVGNVMPGGIGRRLQTAGAQTVEMGQADAGQFPQPTTFAGQIAQSVPGLAAAVGAGVVTGGAGGLLVGAGTAGAQSGGQQYNDAKARVLAAGGTPQQARDVATAEAGPMALFSAATSAIPMGRYLQRFAPGVVDRAVGRLSGNMAFRLLGDAAAEGSQEAAEELASMTLQRIAEDDPEAFQDWGKRLTLSGVAGGVLGGGTGGVLDVAGRIGGTNVRDAQLPAPAPVPAADQRAGTAAAAVAPSDAVGAVAADVPGAGGVVPEAAAVNPFASMADMSDAEVVAALEALDPPAGVPAGALERADAALRAAREASMTDAETTDQIDDATAELDARRAAMEAETQNAVDTERVRQGVLNPSNADYNPTDSLSVADLMPPESTPLPPADDAITAQAEQVAAQPEQGVKQPTTYAEWQAEARRLGLSDKGTLGKVRERVRAAQSSADSTGTSSGVPVGRTDSDTSNNQPKDAPSPTVPTKEPWEMTRGEYAESQITGRIPSHAYETYATSDGISWVKKSKYSVPVGEIEAHGRRVEFRMNNTPVEYLRKDESGEIVRDDSGLATYLTTEEARKKGLPLVDGGIAAFVGDRPVGFASNEFGTSGVWVVEEMQRAGIGARLLKELHKSNPQLARKPIGQATIAGEALVGAHHKSLVREALAANKPVPAEVLADYPTLAANVSGNDAQTTTGSLEPAAPADPTSSPTSTPEVMTSRGTRSRRPVSGNARQQSGGQPGSEQRTTPTAAPSEVSGGTPPRRGKRDTSATSPRPASPGVEKGSTSGEGSDSFERRHRLASPIKGKTGAEIVGYRWMSQMEEGMFRDRRVSDWSQSKISEPTGREIVHLYLVRTPDGKETLMGVGAAKKALGIPEQRLYAIAKREAQAQQTRKQQWDTSAKRIESGAATTPEDAGAKYRAANDPRKMMWGTPEAHAEKARYLYESSTLLSKDGKYVRTGDTETIDELKSRGWSAADPQKAATPKPKGSDPRRRGAAVNWQQVNSPQFKEWFGDWTDPKAVASGAASKVIATHGTEGRRPRIVYHGTNRDFDAFEPGRAGTNHLGMDWRGRNAKQTVVRNGFFFTDDIDTAADYAEQRGGSGANIKPVFLNIRKPIDLTKPDGLAVATSITDVPAKPNELWKLFDGASGKKFVDALKKRGYDGAIIQENYNEKVWVAFDPTQIKSAIGNSGAFSRHNPRISGHALNPIEETLDIARRVAVQRAAKRSRDLAKIEARGAAKAAKDAADTKARLEKQRDSAQVTANAYRQRIADARKAGTAIRDIEARGANEASRALVNAETKLEEATIAVEGMKAKLRATIAENAKEKNLRKIMQDRVIELSRDYLPTDLQGKMLVQVRDAKNAADVFRAIFKIEDLLLDRAKRNTVRLFKATSAPSMLKKLTDARRTQAKGIIAAAQADVEAVAKQGATADERRAALDNLREKVQQLQTIYHEHRFENKLRLRNEWVDRQALLRRLSAAIALENRLPRRRDKRDPTKLDASIVERAGEQARRLLTPEMLFMRIDGDFNTGDVATDLAYREIDKAEDLRDMEHQQYLAAIDALATDLGFSGVADVFNRLSGKIGDASQERIDTGKAEAEIGGANSLSLGQALHLYAASQDHKTAKLISRGVQWKFEGNPETFPVSMDDISKIVSLIDPRLRDFHDRANAMLNAHYPAIQRAQWTVMGYESPAEPNHWRRYRDTDSIPVSGAGKSPADHVVPMLQNAGPLTARKENTVVPLIVKDYTDALLDKADFTFRAKHLMVPLWSARRVMQDPAIVKAIEARYGARANTDIDNYLDRATGLDNRRNILDRLASRYSGAATKLNPFSWLKQPSSYFMAAADVPIQSLAGGFHQMFNPRVQAEMVTHSQKAEARFGQDPGSLYAGLVGGTPYKASPIVAARAAGASAAKALRLLAGTPGAAVAGAKEAGTGVVRRSVGAAKGAASNMADASRNANQIVSKAIPALTDRITISNWMDGAPARGWWKIIKAKHGGQITPAMVEEFERVAARYLNSGRTTQDAFVIQDIKAGGYGAVTAFKSDLTKKLSVLYRAAHLSPAKKLASISGVAASILWVAGVDKLRREMIAALTNDEEEESAFWDSVIDQVAAMVVPYAGDSMTRAIRSFERGYRGNVVAVPVIGTLEQMFYDTYRVAKNIASSKGDPDKVLWDLYDLLSNYAKTQGVPMTPADLTKRVLEKNAE